MNEIVTLPVCVRGHSARTHALDDGTATPALAEHGHLCEDCYRRLEWVLDDLPDIVQAARAAIRPSIVRPPSQRVSGTREPPIPFDTAASETADDLFSRLANWTAAVAVALHIDGPPDLAGVIGEDVNVTGLPVEASPHQASGITDRVREWLVAHLAEAAELALIGDLYADLVPAIDKARGRFGEDGPKERASGRPCPCGHRRVRMVWRAGPVVWCARCLLPQAIDWTVLA